MAVLGTKSAMLIMREAYYGTTRFDDFARRVGITKAAASARLSELVAAGLLTERPYREPGQRVRDEYVLTDAGHRLHAGGVGDVRVGPQAPADPPRLRLAHPDCGAEATVEILCAKGIPCQPTNSGFRVGSR